MKFLVCGILARFPIVSGIRKLLVKASIEHWSLNILTLSTMSAERAL